MTERQWSWMGACATGSSHAKAGTACQDFAACTETVIPGGTALVAVVSDGAGSAQFSALGSRIVVKGICRRLVQRLRSAAPGNVISEEDVRLGLDEVRDRIFAAAASKGSTPREFAATLVAAVILPNEVAVCHVGDGACAFRRSGEQDWYIPSWPAHGEYASSTYFVTDDPEPALRFSRIEGDITDVAIFSDGLERLALDFLNKCAFTRFFDPMSAPLIGQPPGRSRTLSDQLRQFLDAPKVCERTDDDKSLIVAKRVKLQ
jgi:hypothetical protein